MYKAEILADSLSPQGHRLTTMKVTFPRIVLAEFNTHRMFSRNSASSRAIPFNKMVQMVEENPFIPIAWQKDHKGMQGSEYFTDKEDILNRECLWKNASLNACGLAKNANKMKITKQLCNRLLEPFMWHTVIVTATEWENFFKLRCPQYEIDIDDKITFKSKKDVIKYYSDIDFTYFDWFANNTSQADIHIQAIAELMWDAMNESTPKQLQAGEWHIPFGDNITIENLRSHKEEQLNEFNNLTKIKIATARCARISYETLGDNPKIDYEADIKLHNILSKSGHWSPFEHVAKAMDDEEYVRWVNGKLEDGKFEIPNSTEKSDGWCRNFRGFIQYRHLIEK